MACDVRAISKWVGVGLTNNERTNEMSEWCVWKIFWKEVGVEKIIEKKIRAKSSWVWLKNAFAVDQTAMIWQLI